MNSRGFTSRHMMIKDKIKSNKRKATSYKQGNYTRKTTDFQQKLQVRSEIFKALKGRNTCKQEYTTQESYHSKLKERQYFPDKEKQKEFITTKLALQKLLKRLHKREKKKS